MKNDDPKNITSEAQTSTTPRWQKPVGIFLFVIGWLAAVLDFLSVAHWGFHRYSVETAHNPPEVSSIILRSIARDEVLPLAIGLQSIIPMIVIGFLVYLGGRLIQSSRRSSIRDTLLATFGFRLVIVIAVGLILMFADRGDDVSKLLH